MRVLLIEDDIDTAEFILEGLATSPYQIDVAKDGRRGLEIAQCGDHDIVVLDRMLPKLDGLAILKALRSADVKIPILMLTAMSAVQDRVDGLLEGADDYLVKPFSLIELSARLGALARRAQGFEKKQILQVHDLLLDRIRRSVTRAGTELYLQAREIEILELLMLNADRVVTRSMLLESVWGFRFDPGTNIIESHISRIRAKIDYRGERSLIHTVRGQGYVFKAP